MSKVLKATMQVYGRKSPYPSQGKDVMLAMFLIFSLSTCGLPSLGRRYGTRGIFGWSWCGHVSMLWGSCFFNQRLHKILPALLYLQLWLKSETVKATLVSSWDLRRRIRDFSHKIVFCFPSTALPLILGGLAPLWAGGHAGSFWSWDPFPALDSERTWSKLGT